MRRSSPSGMRRSPSPSPNSTALPQQSPQWQKRLLMERSASPTRSVSPRPMPISPLVQRRISAGLPLPEPFFNQARRGWVTPIGRRPNWAEDGNFRRSRSLDTGLGDESKMDEDPKQMMQASSPDMPDTSDSDEGPLSPLGEEKPVQPVLPEVVVQEPSPKVERASRRDRPSLVRTKSKAAQTIVNAINSRKSSRRNTMTDDEPTTPDSPSSSNKFVDRCVTKVKTLMSNK